MRNLILTVCFLLSIQFVTAQQGVVWSKNFGGTAKDAANDILINNDGSIVVAGYSHSNNGDVTGHHGTTATSDGWVTKLDTAGNLLWQISLGGTANDYLNTIIGTDDGGYLCTGYTYSTDGDVSGNHGMADVWAVKLNGNGTLVWSKCYGGSQMDTAVDAVKLYDGQFALIGSTNSIDGNVLSGPVNNSAYDAWVMKLNKTDGNLIWERVINDGDSTISDAGLNITEANNSIIAYVDGAYRQLYYAYQGDPGSYRIDHRGAIYVLEETNGSGGLQKIVSSHITDMVMYKSGAGLNFIYDGLYSNPNPFNCTSRRRTYVKLGFDLGLINEKTLGSEDCTRFDSYLYAFTDYVTQGHGMITKTNGNLSYVGKYSENTAPYNTGAYALSFGVFGGGTDKFRSIKEFAWGEEFVIAGYQNYGSLGGGDCWIVKTQSLNNLQGNFYIDYNNNNVKDANEPPFRRAVAKTIKQNATDSWWSYSINGLSQSIVNLGTYKTSASVLHPYYTLTADTATNTFTTYRNTVTINYPVHPIPGSRDYAVFLSSLSPLRPGFVTQNRITYTNFGVDTLTNKSVRLVLNSHLNFTSSTPAPTSVIADTITWNIAQLLPDSSGFINLYLTTDNIPDVNIDDTLRLTAYIDNTGDVKPSDNVSSILQGVRGSYDPNDKKENYGGSMPLTEASSGKYLTYTIRFQNTGNDTAFNIVVRDTLSTLLDSTSFEMINASHAYTVSIKDGKYVVWKFNDIKLPDSFSNEPLSHGSITYRIKPKLPIGIGEKIKNSAAIYFDYNPPIITNTSITEIKGNPTIASWTGAVSTAWENALNWSNRLVPDMNTTVTIPANVPNYPEINSNASCYRITVMPSATVLVKTGFKLQVTAKN